MRVAVLALSASLAFAACAKATHEVSTVDRDEQGVRRQDLDQRYERCVLADGIDPQGVQVLFDDVGRPWDVKRGAAVPHEIHEDCFLEIGGDPSYEPVFD